MTHNIFDVFHIGPVSKEHVLRTLFIRHINLKEEKVNKSKIKYTSGKCLFEWQGLFVCLYEYRFGFDKKKITGRFDLILKLPVKSNLFCSLSYK